MPNDNEHINFYERRDLTNGQVITLCKYLVIFTFVIAGIYASFVVMQKNMEIQAIEIETVNNRLYKKHEQQKQYIDEKHP